MPPPIPAHRVTEMTFERKPWWVFWRTAKVIGEREVWCYCYAMWAEEANGD